MKPTPRSGLCVLGVLALLLALQGCADKPRPRDAHQDSARLSKEPLDPTDLNGRLLRGVGLP